MAAAKEAIVLVLDIGKSMKAELDVGKSVHGDKDCKTVLENAKICVSMIIQRKIFSESKDEIALITFGSCDTSNKLAEKFNSEYSNINVVQDLQPANWELLEYVNNIEGTNISTDFIRDNALFTGINLIQNTNTGKKFFTRRILFLSSFDGYFCNGNISKICEELKVNKIDLNFIGPVAFPIEDDVSNHSFSESYQKSDIIPKRSEFHISKILKEVGGESYSFNEAIPALIYYQKKKVLPIPWNANLDIGINLTIPISAYIKVSECKHKPWKSAYAHKLNAKIEKDVTYLMNDEMQTKVSKDGIIPAYKYGTTLVPYSEEDKVNMDYQSGEKGMKVLGFTKAENIQRYHYAGDKSMYVFGQKNRELAGEILAPFIQALYDTKMVAIVRYVYSQRSAPKIGFLSPKIKENYECLVFIILPFMEDLRHFVFSPLDSDPKNLPTEEQLEAVDNLITSMDLTSPLNLEDGDTEILKPKCTVNPYLQRLYQSLQYRAFHPEKPLPEILPHIKALLNPSPKVLKNALQSIKKIKSLFLLKEMVSKKTTDIEHYIFPNGKTEESIRKLKSDDSSEVEEKLNLVDAVTDQIVKVGSVNPVRDFQYLVNNRALPFQDACKQMIDIVFKYLQDSGNLKLFHSKVLSICKELRRASLKENEPTKYNEFMLKLQNALLECDEELWEKIKNERIGLISKKELSTSDINAVQAEEFLAISNVKNNKDSLQGTESCDANEDYDNLLDQL